MYIYIVRTYIESLATAEAVDICKNSGGRKKQRFVNPKEQAHRIAKR
jgi:hypothetical protein